MGGRIFGGDVIYSYGPTFRGMETRIDVVIDQLNYFKIGGERKLQVVTITVGGQQARILLRVVTEDID